MKKIEVWRVTAVVLFAAALVLVSADPALAQIGPLDKVITKGNDLKSQLILVGKMLAGLISAALLILALFGRVAWKWVICAIVATVGLTGIDPLQNWLNQ